MTILISILIHLPFVIQILLLLSGLAISVSGVIILVKIIANPSDNVHQISTEQVPVSTPIKKKRPTSTF